MLCYACCYTKIGSLLSLVNDVKIEHFGQFGTRNIYRKVNKS